MPLSKSQVFDFFEKERGRNTSRWADPNMLLCETIRNAAGREEPGFNVMFARAENGDPEFDRLVLYFRMADIPDFAADWCKAWCDAQRLLREFTSAFWHQRAVHIRHGLLVASGSLDEDTLQKNFWMFASTIDQLNYDIDHRNQR